MSIFDRFRRPNRNDVRQAPADTFVPAPDLSDALDAAREAADRDERYVHVPYSAITSGGLLDDLGRAALGLDAPTQGRCPCGDSD